MMLLQIDAGKAATVAAKATEQLIKSADQESFLVQLLFWLVLIFGAMLFALGYAVIAHLHKRNKALQAEKDQQEYIDRLTKPNHV